MKKEVKPCPCCLGDGIRQDARKIGREMRKLRKAAGKGNKEVSMAMGISKSHLSYLESGRRRWQLGMVEKYREALK